MQINTDVKDLEHSITQHKISKTIQNTSRKYNQSKQVSVNCGHSDYVTEVGGH